MTGTLLGTPRGAGARAAFILLALMVTAAGRETRAATFYDVSLGLDVGDDARIFLNLTNDYYAPPPQVAVQVVKRCARPENDYPVILLLAQASHRSPQAVLDLRLKGLSWADVMFQLRVAPSALFVGLDHDPGPPYGKAWGYWKHHKPHDRFAISDRQFVDLAKLRIASGYYKVSPYTVISERQRGVSVERYAADRHRARHPEKGAKPSKAGEHGPGQGHGHGQGEGHGQGSKGQGAKPDKP
jgi:hypothetical protein